MRWTLRLAVTSHFWASTINSPIHILISGIATRIESILGWYTMPLTSLRFDVLGEVSQIKQHTYFSISLKSCQIMSHLHPQDILHLHRSCCHLARVIDEDPRHLRQARHDYGFGFDRVLPPWRTSSFSEVAFCATIFEGGPCTVCIIIPLPRCSPLIKLGVRAPHRLLSCLSWCQSVALLQPSRSPHLNIVSFRYVIAARIVARIGSIGDAFGKVNIA